MQPRIDRLPFPGDDLFFIFMNQTRGNALLVQVEKILIYEMQRMDDRHKGMMSPEQVIWIRYRWNEIVRKVALLIRL